MFSPAIDDLLFQSQLTQERVIYYLFLKLWTQWLMKAFMNLKQNCQSWLQMSFSKNGGTYFCGSKFNDSSFLCQLTQEKVTYLFRKPRIVAIDCSYETEIKSIEKGSIWVLVKIRWAWPTLEWCHSQFLSWLKKL